MPNNRTDHITLAPLTINPRFDNALKLDEFEIKGVKFIREASIHRAKRAKVSTVKDSKIWQWGERLIRVSDNKIVFYCYECEARKYSQALHVVNGTSHTSKHLWERHRISKETGEKVVVSDSPIVTHLIEQQEVTAKWRFDRFKELLIRWVIYCHIAFFMLDNQYFRDLLDFLNSKLAKLLPKRRTIRDWVMEAYMKDKEKLAEELSESLSSVSLSFDLWTSPNYYSLMAIHAHFINKDGQRRDTLLALRRLEGEHTGENQGGLIMEVIEEYGIEGKVSQLLQEFY